MHHQQQQKMAHLIEYNRIHNLVEHLTPLVNEPNVTNFLYDLPKGMGLAANILDALIQPEINSILETGIPINELLKEIDFSKIMSNDDQLTKSGLQRSDVPRVLDGFKAAARAAVPHVKSIMKNFSKIMDLEKEISALNIKGSAFDLLACELFHLFFSLSPYSFSPPLHLFLCE